LNEGTQNSANNDGDQYSYELPNSIREPFLFGFPSSIILFEALPDVRKDSVWSIFNILIPILWKSGAEYYAAGIVQYILHIVLELSGVR
jgi:hypothetical protein